MMLKLWSIVIMSALLAISCASTDKTMDVANASIAKASTTTNGDTLKKIVKTPTEWKSILSPEAYYVLREQGTERAFTGELWDNKKAGTYTCSACELPLFSSTTKFKSGTGWPSFWQPIQENNVGIEVDKKYGMTRTEVHCNRCGGHLGHIFDDGPKPTGLRYCINSISLKFAEKK